MLSSPSHHPVLHVLSNSFQENTLHNFLRVQSEADQLLIPGVFLLAFSEDMCNTGVSDALNPSFHNFQRVQSDISYLSKHHCMHLS